MLSLQVGIPDLSSFSAIDLCPPVDSTPESPPAARLTVLFPDQQTIAPPSKFIRRGNYSHLAVQEQ